MSGVLKNYEVDPNVILLLASKYCRKNLIRYAIKKGATNFNNAIKSFTWSKRGCCNTIEILIENGANNESYIKNCIKGIIDEFKSDILDFVLYIYE